MLSPYPVRRAARQPTGWAPSIGRTSTIVGSRVSAVRAVVTSWARRFGTASRRASDDRATAVGCGHARAVDAAHAACRRGEYVEFGRADAEVVAQRLVRLIHIPAERRVVGSAQRRHRLQDPHVLGDDVAHGRAQRFGKAFAQPQKVGQRDVAECPHLGERLVEERGRLFAGGAAQGDAALPIIVAQVRIAE